ncbi:AAA family ATPase [Reyranella sp.]|uniref:AAA family ATPase n=1 Tax=Reyranella sp. TaxID=1929291 RepID=UPI003D0F13F9
MATDVLACPKCRSGVFGGDNFCSVCGQALRLQCENCQAPLLVGQHFCRSCGTRVTVPERRDEPDEGPHNVFATLLFLDIKGSSSLIESLEPEAAAELMDAIHAGFARHIHRFGGRVLNFQGDGFFAIFGAPRAREDHAIRALLAAVSIRDEVVRRVDPQTPTVRIGVHSGDVFTRLIKTDFSADFDAMGVTVHVTKRLEEAAVSNGILTSYATYRLARHLFDFESLGVRPLRGLSHELQQFRVLGLRRSPEQPDGNLSAERPLVGRAPEMAILSTALELARGHCGQAIILMGEGGIGKSRLSQELAKIAKDQGCLVVIHEEVTEGLTHSYSAILRLMRQLARIDRGEIEPSAPLLYNRDDILAGDRTAAPSDNDVALRSEFSALLRRVSEERAMIVVVDDAQWSDSESLEILFESIEDISDLSVLFIICTRELKSIARFGDIGNASVVRIGPLREPECQMLFSAMAGDSPPAMVAAGGIASVTGGNPLFIEELAFAATTGSLDDDRVQQIFANPDGEPTGRIRSVVLDRVGRLKADARRLLQCLALLQFDCASGLLADASGLQDASVVDEALRTLQSGGYLRRARVGDETLYGIRHSLLRQIIERSIIRADKQRFHRAIREALGKIDGPNQLFETLAHHATQAGDWVRAEADWREAHARALEASLYKHAALCLENALDATTRAPVMADRSVRQNEIRMQLRLSLAPMGEYRRLYFHLSQITPTDPTMEEPGARLLRLLSLAHVENICGNVRSSRLKAAEALALAQRADLQGARIAATYFLAQGHEFASNHAECVALSSRTLDELLPSARHERFQLTGTASVLFASLLAHSLAYRNRPAEAGRFGALAVQIAEETDRPFDKGVAYFGQGWARMIGDDLTGAMPCFELAAEHVRDQRLGLLESMIDCRLRYLKAVVGGEPLSVARPEEACRNAVEMPHIWCWSRLLCAMAAHHAGFLDQASRIIGEILPMVRANHYRGISAWAYSMLADIAHRSHAPNRIAVARRARRLSHLAGLSWKFDNAEWASEAAATAAEE